MGNMAVVHPGGLLRQSVGNDVGLSLKMAQLVVLGSIVG